MTLDEMQTCAAETLSYFMQTMPDVPFTGNDIIIEFAKKNDMAKRAKSFCAKYVPDKIINESQTRQLNSSIAANALIGREKSAVIVRLNHKINRQKWREILFHEFMHIFCAKTEVDGVHFMDVYGNVHTPDENPVNEIYDGFLNAGYVVWEEFIAQYYALLKTKQHPYTFSDIADYAFGLLGEVSIAYDEKIAKDSFSMACAYLLTCDGGNILSNLTELDDTDLQERKTERSLRDCLEHLQGNLQKEKPWKISEEFISDLGSKFLMFKTMNSIDAGLLG